MKAMWVTIGGLLLVSSGAAVFLPGSGDDGTSVDQMGQFLTTPKGQPISADARAAMSGTRFDPNLGSVSADASGGGIAGRPTTAMRSDSVRTSPLDTPPANKARTPRTSRSGAASVNTTTGTDYKSTRDRNADRQRIIEERQRQMEVRRAELAAQRDLQARQRLGSTGPTNVDLSRVTPQQVEEGATTTTGAVTGATGTPGGQTGGNGSTGGTGNSGGGGGAGSGGGSGGGGTNAGGGTGGGRGNSGGGGGGGGSTSGGANSLNGRSVWIEVDNTGCDELDGYRTADLFVRFNQAVSVLTIQSRAETGLSIENGAFAQHPDGNNARPSSAQIVADPCIAFDSYLAINEAGIVFTPPEPGVLDWGPSLVGNWFSLGGTASVQDRARFGDQGHYVQVARITAPAGETRVGGTLVVSVRAGTSTAVSNVTVNVFNEPSVWSGDAPTMPPFESEDSGTGGGGGSGGDGGTGGGGSGGDGGTGGGGSGGDGGTGGGGSGGDGGTG
ncbi:MAG: hypothetical protein KDA16_13295, partial [Phycisphaerales bacterium]|nr:hypothetical protein [Phycisphaerales bacterium]